MSFDPTPSPSAGYCVHQLRLVLAISLVCASTSFATTAGGQGNQAGGALPSGTPRVPTLTIDLDSAKFSGRLPFDQRFYLIGKAAPALIKIDVWIKHVSNTTWACLNSKSPDPQDFDSTDVEHSREDSAQAFTRTSAKFSLQRDTATGRKLLAGQYALNILDFAHAQMATIRSLPATADSAESAHYKWVRPSGDSRLSFAIAVSSLHPNANYCIWIRSTAKPPDSLIVATRAVLLDPVIDALYAAMLAGPYIDEAIVARIDSTISVFLPAGAKLALADSGSRVFATTERLSRQLRWNAEYVARLRAPRADSATDRIQAYRTLLTSKQTPFYRLLHRFDSTYTKLRQTDAVGLSVAVDSLQSLLGRLQIEVKRDALAMSRVPLAAANGRYQDGAAFAVVLAVRSSLQLRRAAYGAVDLASPDDTVESDGPLASASVISRLHSSTQLAAAVHRMEVLGIEAQSLADLARIGGENPQLAQQMNASAESLSAMHTLADSTSSRIADVRSALRKAGADLNRLDAIADSMITTQTAPNDTSMLGISSSSSAPFADRAKMYISADIGVLAAPGSLTQIANFTIVPYVGFNIYPLPVNREAPFEECAEGPKQCVAKRLAFTVGVTTSSVARPPSRTDLFGSHSLYMAIGARVWSFFRVGVGGLLVQQASADAQHGPRLNVLPTISSSIDWDIGSTIGGVGSVLSGGK